MDLKYELAGFNTKSVLKFKTGEELAAHKSYQHLWPKVTPEIRRQRLIEVWELSRLVTQAGKKKDHENT